MDNILMVQFKAGLIVGLALVGAALVMTWLLSDSDEEGF